MGDGISYLHFLRYLDAGNEISYVTDSDFISRLFIKFQHANLVRIIDLISVNELNFIVLLNRAVENPEVNLNAAKRIKNRVENHRLQRRFSRSEERRVGKERRSGWSP